ncbi:MAG TPA: hypothetical protein VE954_27370 [Oligoflexus sp.]|uniref:hypothetical protein n=1 Tax=Oligoflexus sp. TaxID=1971216 RepID=UPI002D754453|nr:hypothetical protein [Oligoflexus sp.]HYX36845.1 hypothetical protein [Oligoflexus sp.]
MNSTAAAPEINFRSVEIHRAGQKIKAEILMLDNTEGLTVQQAADLFDTSTQNIHKHISKYAICSQPLVENICRTLKSKGIIPFKTPKHVLFIPKTGLKDLTWHIGTDAAKAAYYQLWDDAEELAALKPRIAELENQRAELLQKLDAVLAQSELVMTQNLVVVEQNQQYARIFKAGKRRIMRARAKQRAVEELIVKSKKPKGESRKKVVMYESLGRNIFEGEQFKAIEKYRKIVEMNPLEYKTYKVQHSCRTVDGAIRKGICQPLAESHPGNKDILDSVNKLANASSVVLGKVMPKAGTVVNAVPAELQYLN